MRSIISGGSDALQERMKRRPSAPAGRSSAARERSRLWIVGTAEYHVAPESRTMRQKDSGLNFDGTTTVPPESSVESVEATRPCTWKSGMTQSETSSGESP